MFSIRASASRCEFACTVVKDPSWPVFMACSMSKASSPRTSPTTMRSGRIRKLLMTQLSLPDGAFAFNVRRPGFQAHDMFLLHLQFGRILDSHDPLIVRDVTGQHVQQRRLAGAGSTRH